MTQPEPKPAPNLFQRRKLFVCSHRWPDGTSSWAACQYTPKGWYTTCLRCGVFARCK